MQIVIIASIPVMNVRVWWKKFSIFDHKHE